MWKLLRLLVAANFIRHHRFAFGALLVAVILVALILMIFSDLKPLMAEEKQMFLLSIKWSGLIAIGLLIFFLIRHLLLSALRGLSLVPHREPDAKERRILSKERLQTRSECMMDKYRKRPKDVPDHQA